MAHTLNTNCSDRNIHTKRTSFLDLFWQISAAARQRKILRHLDDTALKDIGITRKQAQTEAKRPIWDVPGHWLK